MYRAVLEGDVYEVSSPAIAEMEKILENTYRNINIGLVNELTMLCDRMGISMWEVIDAAKTKPYGFRHSIQVRDLADTVSRLIHITLHGKQESMDSIHL